MTADRVGSCSFCHRAVPWDIELTIEAATVRPPEGDVTTIYLDRYPPKWAAAIRAVLANPPGRRPAAGLDRAEALIASYLWNGAGADENWLIEAHDIVRDAATVRPPEDWACVDCRPDSPVLIEGFRCMVHEDRARRVPARPTPIDEYQRVYERSGVDPHGIYGPTACSMPGHVPGCSGKAGGDHELLPEWIAIHGEGYDVEIEMAD